jgi:cellulose synthase operon protein C
LNFDIEDSRQVALSKAAYIQKFQQNYRAAAESLEKYFEIYPESDDADETLWSASVAWERAGDEDQMVRVLDRYLREYGDDWERSERIVGAHHRMALMYEDRGDQRRAEAKYEEIIDLHDHLMGGEDEEMEPPPGAAAIREMAARSQFMLIEPAFEEWDNIAIAGSPQQQERLLEQKIEGAQELRDKYSQVFQYNNLDWNMAAFFRRANVQHQFAAALYDVPVPFEEGSDEYWMYQDMIDDILFPMEEQAIESYEEILDRARSYDPPIANEWTERTIIALHFFRPQEYPLFKDEKRPRRDALEMGIPLLSQAEYERRMERREVQDDQQLEMPMADEDDEEADDAGEEQ